MGHLDADAPDLPSLLRDAAPERQRAYALAAVRLALARQPLADGRAADALAALEAGRTGAPAEQAAVEALTAELDEVAWDEQDRGAEDEYAAAFMRARAAGALAAAFDDDPAEAAYNATYEANAALEDVPALRAALEAAG